MIAVGLCLLVTPRGMGGLASDVEHLPVSRANEILSRLAFKVTVNEDEIEVSFEPSAVSGIQTDGEANPTKFHFKFALDRQNFGHEPRLRLQPSERSTQKPHRSQPLAHERSANPLRRSA